MILKTRRSILSIILIVLFMCTFTGFRFTAGAADVQVTIDGGSAVQGGTISIPIRFTTVPQNGIYALNFSVVFDTAIFSLQSITIGNICNKNATFSGSLPNSSAAISGDPIFVYYDNSDDFSQAITDTGTFATMVLKVKSTAIPGNTQIKVSDLAGDPVAFGDSTAHHYTVDKVPGTITITSATVPVSSVSVVPAIASMKVGDSLPLTATVLPANASIPSVTWSSDNTAVATVNQNTGVVTAVAAGKANITAVSQADATKNAACAVTVSLNTVAVASVSVAPSTASMIVGDTQTLTATVLPADATNKTVTWSSDNTAVATVNPSTGVVTAVAAGSASITAVSQADATKTATCVVKVANRQVAVTGVKLSQASAVLNLGDKLTLSAAVTPNNATNTSVLFTSDNNASAIVDPNTGIVTAVKAGTANIKASSISDPGVFDVCAVSVKPAKPAVSLGMGITPGTINVVGADATMQYSIGSGSYTNVTAAGLSNVAVNANDILHVRVAAAGLVPASDIQDLTVNLAMIKPVDPPAGIVFTPGTTVGTTKMTIPTQSVARTVQYKIGGGNWTDVSSLPVTVDNIQAAASTSVLVKFKATALQPESLPLSLTIGSSNLKNAFTVTDIGAASFVVGNDVNTSVSLTNNDSTARTAVLIAALYSSDNKMLRYSYAKMTIAPGSASAQTLSAGFSTSDLDRSKSYTVKLMVWDDFTTMNPFCDPIVKPMAQQ